MFPREVYAEPAVWDDSYLVSKTVLLSKYVTGIALAIVVFSIPYLIYLWGSGTPENLKKANQYLGALVGGFLIVLLASAIVSVIGSDLIQI